MGICSTRAKRETIEESPLNFWSIEVEQQDGTVQTLDQFKDRKALLIVNVNEKASGGERGFDSLNTIKQKYRNQGVEVLVFPGRKETKPGTRQSSYQTNSKLKSVDFPVFSSLQLNGQKTHPLYKYLRTNSTLYNANKKDCGMISSDFTKFLIDRFGNVIKMYSPNSSVNEIQTDIENLLRLT